MAIRRVHYAWIIVAVTFLVTMSSGAIRSMPGVLVLPLENEFGWSRATISLAISINLFLFGFTGPFAEAIMVRIGIRRLILAALIILAAGISLTTQMREAWQLQLLWGVLVGLGTGAIASWMGATIANRWFVERRGLVVGLLSAGNSTGQILFLPLMAALIVSTGWRVAAVTIAVYVLLVVPLVAKFVHSFPQDIGLQPYGFLPGTDGALPLAPSKPTGDPFRAAFGTLRKWGGDRTFLLLAGTYFVCGSSANGLLGTHLIPASVEHGIPEVAAAGMIGIMGLFNIVGATMSGWLSDRADCRWLLACYYSLRGLSLIFLPFAFAAGYPGLAVFVVLNGLDWAATGPPTVRLVADTFGRRNVGAVYAWLLVVHQIGAASIAFGAGALRTWLGDYTVAFMFSGSLVLLAAGMALSIRRQVVPDDLPGQTGERDPAGAVAVPVARR